MRCQIENFHVLFSAEWLNPYLSATVLLCIWLVVYLHVFIALLAPSYVNKIGTNYHRSYRSVNFGKSWFI